MAGISTTYGPFPGIFSESSIPPHLDNTASVVGTVFAEKESRNVPLKFRNNASWVLEEDQEIRGGIPTTLRICILLHRIPQPFLGKFDVDVGTSGISFERRRRNAWDEPLLFDPSQSQRRFAIADGYFQDLARDLNIDEENVDRVNLHELVRPLPGGPDCAFTPEFPPTFIDDADLQRQARAEIEAKIDAIVDQPADQAPIEGFEFPTLGRVAETPLNGFYVELWNPGEKNADAEANARGGVGLMMRRDNPGLEGVPSQRWPYRPDDGLLRKYFSWLPLHSPEVRKTSDPQHPRCAFLYVFAFFILWPYLNWLPGRFQERDSHLITRLIRVRKSNNIGCQTFAELKEIIDGESLDAITGFFAVPGEYFDYRRHDGGTCRKYGPSKSGKRPCLDVSVCQNRAPKRGGHRVYNPRHSNSVLQQRLLVINSSQPHQLQICCRIDPDRRRHQFG